LSAGNDGPDAARYAGAMELTLEHERYGDCESEWLARPVSELAAHITAAYHERTRDVLPRMLTLVSQETSAFGEAHVPHLRDLSAILAELRDEVDTHARTEDDLLFPVLVAHEHPDVLTTRLTADALVRLVDALAAEHVRIRRLLGRLSDHVENAPSARFSPEWADVRHALMMLCEHLIEELDLEDRCLLPRALAIAELMRVP
jgi:iron-sulfur cluster repair protein YtfE (RIC family)